VRSSNPHRQASRVFTAIASCRASAAHFV